MATVGRRAKSGLWAAVSIWAELEPLRREVEAYLADILGASSRSHPPALAEAMRYSLLGPGKRVRPILCLLTCEAFGSHTGQGVPAAAAVEMVHTYSLVHDDLPAMDDDDLRRGRPTCHKAYGEALGLLTGDALLTMAFQQLADAYPGGAGGRMCGELAHAAGAAGMVGGQTLDLIAEGKIAGPVPTTVGDLETIHRRKTGALIGAAVRLGIHAASELSGGPIAPADWGHEHEAADRYADALGLLFQVTDDLLDVQSTEEATGKRVGKDAGRGKLTYPGLLGVEASRRRADELCGEAVAAADWLTRWFQQEDGRPDAGRKLAELARWVASRDR